MNNWTNISEQALAANYRALVDAAAPHTEVLAVIKADAYGHGAVACAPMLVRAGARWLGVTCASEGARVRTAVAAQSDAGIDATRILVMCGSLPEDAETLAAYGLTPVVWTAEQLAGLPPGTRVHVEIDTGMGRQGLAPGEPLGALLAAIAAAGLALEAVFTHFCSAEVAASELTERQQSLFEKALAQVIEAGLHPALIHAGNSSTLDNPAPPRGWLARVAASAGARAMVRTGLALYGYTLPIAGGAAPRVRPALQPVLTWQARVLAVRTLAPGDTVGYNATFTATSPMHVALLPVGYADGLRRELSGPAGWVMLHGRRAPILGRISMNLTVVDVTGIAGVAPGDAATILGPGITAGDHARLAGTIAYEILCGIHSCG